MPSLATAAQAAEALKAPAVTVTSERCARYRHKASTCEYCLGVCPAHAVSFDPLNAPAIDEEACTGCGACASVCPTGALEHANPDDREVEADIAMSVEMNGAVTFACARAGDVPGAIRVPCLATVDVPFVLEALSRGASSVHLISGDCDSCSSRQAGWLGQTMADMAASLASALGREGAVTLTVSGASEEEAAAGPALSRRAFLLALSGRGADAGARVARAILPRGDAREAPDPRLVRSEFLKHVPTSRLRLTSALVSLAEARDAALEGFLFSLPAVDEEQCRGCAMCAKCCPTGALAAERDGDTFTLTFDAAICTSCYLCEDVCGKDAITRSEGLASAIFAAAEPYTVVCKDCEDPFAIDPERKIGRLFSTLVSHA